MAYYTTCPHCGANLDPGERCDCPEALEESTPKRRDRTDFYPGGYDYQMKEEKRYDASCCKHYRQHFVRWGEAWGSPGYMGIDCGHCVAKYFRNRRAADLCDLYEPKEEASK